MEVYWDLIGWLIVVVTLLFVFNKIRERVAINKLKKDNKAIRRSARNDWPME